MQFRYYITDSIYYKNQNKFINKRFSEILNPQIVEKVNPQETVTNFLKMGILKLPETNGEET